MLPLLGLICIFVGMSSDDNGCLLMVVGLVLLAS